MSFRQVIVILSYCSPVLLILGVLLAVYYFRNLKEAYRVLGVYLVLLLAMEIGSRYIGMFTSVKSNLFLIPIFSFFELMIFTVLYYRHLIKGYNAIPRLISVLALLVLGLELINLDVNYYQSFQSYGKVFGNLLIIFFALHYFWKLVKSGELLNQDIATINSGILLYFSINLLIYLPINFLVNADLDITYYFWTVNIILNLAFYAFISYNIWKTGKTRK